MRCDVSKHAHLRNSERVIWVVRICVPFAMAPLGHLFLCVAVFFAWARNGQSLAAMMAIKNESKTVTMEKEILKLMGLPRRPQISLATMMFGRRMSAPRFMMELYNSLAANQSVTVDGPRFNGSVTDPRAVRADTIVGYLNHIRGARPKISRHHATFRFKLEVPAGEKITDTGFRIYKEPIYSGRKNISWENTTYVVRLYRVVHPAQMLKLIEMRVLRSWDYGWQEFDISESGSIWAKDPNKNYGMELSVETQAHEQIDASGAGFVGFHGLREKRPFLLSFFEQQDGSSTQRTFHQSSKGTLGPSGRKRRSLDPQFAGDGGGSSASKSCRRLRLYVSFKDLGWQHWIIAPEGYSAFYCNGECSFPLNGHMNATNHAIVQALVYLMNPSTVPRPCCAPTNLGPISVLYYDDSNNVVLKKYTSMVVEACGCH